MLLHLGTRSRGDLSDDLSGRTYPVWKRRSPALYPDCIQRYQIGNSIKMLIRGYIHGNYRLGVYYPFWGIVLQIEDTYISRRGIFLWARS